MRFNLFTDELALLGRNSLEFVVTPENRLRCSASSKAVDTAADFIVIER
ncbi:MAG: hypothetical protein HKO62_05770 [Gammaproteobacteria bacterium]|nr:hypothetical protein [Gammaproteobacteria bacterium]